MSEATDMIVLEWISVDFPGKSHNKRPKVLSRLVYIAENGLKSRAVHSEEDGVRRGYRVGLQTKTKISKLFQNLKFPVSLGVYRGVIILGKLEISVLPSVILPRYYRGNYRGNVTVKKHNYRYRGVRYRDKPHLPTPWRPLP